MKEYNVKRNNDSKSAFDTFMFMLSKLGSLIIILLCLLFFVLRKAICKLIGKKYNQTYNNYIRKVKIKIAYNTNLETFKHHQIKLKKKVTINLAGTVALIIIFIALIIVFINKYTDDNEEIIGAKNLVVDAAEEMDHDVSSETINLFKYNLLIWNLYIQEHLMFLDASNFNIELNSMIMTRIEQPNANQVILDEEPDAGLDISGIIFDESLMLHIGDESEEVALIQERLMDLHYMDADEPTNYYGEITSYAVSLFQRGHGLSPDGIAGYETLSLLFSEEASEYLVREGDYGTDVARIKERLAELGYLDEGNTDKSFDEDTDYAIRVFQGRNELSQDGIVGYYTIQTLFDSSAKAAKTTVSDNNSDEEDDTTDNSTEDSTTVTDKSDDSDESDDGGNGDDTENLSYDADDASSLVSFAKSIMNMGYTYLLGGKAPPAMDCSGFVYYCLNQTGNNIGYMTSSGWAKSSYSTISSINDVKAGDILCFDGHVAICIGNGKMIDSSSSQNCIRITNYEDSSYWNKKWICGKRVFD